MKATFIIPKGTRPELMASSPRDRMLPSTMGIQIDTEKSVAIATNGKAIVTSDAMKEALKMSKEKRALPATIDIDGECVSVMTSLGMRNGHRVIDSQFPNYEACIPTSSPKLRLAIDADLLATLAKSLGVEKVVIEIPAESIHGPASDEVVKGAMIVRPYESDAPSSGAYGAIMPCVLH